MINNKLSANEWQNFSLKKDIEKTNRLVKRTSEIGLAVLFDLCIALFAVLFDRFFDFVNTTIRITVFIITLILLFVPVIILLVKKIKDILREKSVSVNNSKVREYIDSFDNEVCYYVMMADSFLDLLENSEEKATNHRVFYYSETRFYLNKSIDKLSPMLHKLNLIFDNDLVIVSMSKKVSVARLLNLLDLIKEIKEKAERLKQTLPKKDLIQELCPDDIYNKRLNQFIEMAHRDLHIDLSRYK